MDNQNVKKILLFSILGVGFLAFVAMLFYFISGYGNQGSVKETNTNQVKFTNLNSKKTTYTSDFSKNAKLLDVDFYQLKLTSDYEIQYDQKQRQFKIYIYTSDDAKITNTILLAEGALKDILNVSANDLCNLDITVIKPDIKNDGELISDNISNCNSK